MDKTTQNWNRPWHALQRALAQDAQPYPSNGVMASYRRVHGVTLARGLHAPARPWLSRAHATV